MWRQIQGLGGVRRGREAPRRENGAVGSSTEGPGLPSQEGPGVARCKATKSRHGQKCRSRRFHFGRGASGHSPRRIRTVQPGEGSGELRRGQGTRAPLPPRKGTPRAASGRPEQPRPPAVRGEEAEEAPAGGRKEGGAEAGEGRRWSLSWVLETPEPGGVASLAQRRPEQRRAWTEWSAGVRG